MKEELEEVKVNYIYLVIPAEYVCVYHKLITLVSEFGKDIIDDCTYACKSKGKNIANCWSLFQSAVAAYNIGEYKKADFYIKYIEDQFKYIYKDSKVQYPTTIPVNITPDGKLQAIVSCCKPKFFVDTNTGRLLAERANCEDDSKYEIINHDLTFKKYERDN